MKKTLITIVGMAIGLSSYAQQAITHNQYNHSRTAVNTASTLMQQGVEVSFIGRRQWVGLDGAPTVYWGSGHLGFQKLGATAGFNLRHESMAVENLTEASLFFAKSVRISQSEYIGLSLNAGVAHHNGNFSSLDGMDGSFRDDIRDTDGLVGFSAIVYRPERYYAGISMPRLVLSTLGNGGNKEYDFRNQYHLVAGALFALGTDFHLKPSVLVTYAENLRPQADFSAMVYMKRAFGVGANVRSYGDISALAQVNFQGFGIGYGYQFNPNNQPLNRRIDNSTHEIGISYRFGNDKMGLL